MLIPRPAPALKFSRKSLLFIAAWITLTSPMAFAQSSAVTGAASPPASNAAPSFDVATIKPHTGMMRMRGLMYQPDGVTGTASLSMLVMNAYGILSEDQVSGAPGWAKDEMFDVQAKMSAADFAEMQKLSPEESKVRRELMLQTLLAERCKLKTHPETKQVPVYELVVAKAGSNKLIDAATDPNPKLNRGEDGKPSTGIRFLKDTANVQAYSMKSLAGFLSQPVAGVGRPVLDKTGLISTYDFTINWSVYSAGAGSTPGSPEDNTASIFGALKEVGLKLQPATGPIGIIVIDHVERPSEN